MFLQSALNAEGQVQAVIEGTVTSFNGAQAYVESNPLVSADAVAAADNFSGGLRYSSDGALRVVDASAGAPDDSVFVGGVLVSPSGQLCIIPDTVAAGGFVIGGVAVTAEGAVYMGGIA